MQDEKVVSRRKFLKVAGSLLGGGVLLCGGGAYLGMRAPASVVYPVGECGESGLKKILVAYASKCGATGEIAAKITEQLCAGGFQANLSPAGEVKSVAGYSGIVLGTAIYMGKPLNEALKFAEKFLTAASNLPVALFDVCLTMKEDTPENLQTALGYLDGFRGYFTPALVAAFAGRIDFEKLPLLYRTFAQADQEGILAEGDYRDWGKITDWTGSLASLLF